jgi:hypothetical protein
MLKEVSSLYNIIFQYILNKEINPITVYKFLEFISNQGFKIFEIDNKNNCINHINDLKLLLEKYRNSFCDIILVKK